MATHRRQHHGVPAGQFFTHAAKAQGIIHAVTDQSGMLAAAHCVCQRSGYIHANSQVLVLDALYECLRGSKIVEHDRHRRGFRHGPQNLLEIRLVAFEPMRKEAFEARRPERAAIAGITHIARTVFNGNLEKAF